MSNLLIILLAGFIVAYAFSRIDIHINITYQRSASDDDLWVHIYLLKRFLVYKLHVPVIEMTDKSKLPWLKSELHTHDEKVGTHPKRERRFVMRVLNIYLHHPKKWQSLMRKFRHYRSLYYTFANQLAKSVQCERLKCKITYGSEDAAQTGIMVGAFWAVSGLAIKVCKSHLAFLRQPEIRITPSFGKRSFDIDFLCIFRLTVGHVIIASLILLNVKYKGAAGDG